MEKKTVAVDVDGVLARYDGWKGREHFGDPIPGAVEFTRILSEFASITIFTTRCKPQPEEGLTAEQLGLIVKAWLDKHGFVYDLIYIGVGKPIASAYIDDRAVECVPQQEGTEAYVKALVLTQALCGSEHK